MPSKIVDYTSNRTNVLVVVQHVKRKIPKKTWNKTLMTPDLPVSGVTTNEQLNRSVQHLHISYFSGVYMRDALPSKARYNESIIVNLDDTTGSGTHWVACAKRGNNAIYF